LVPTANLAGGVGLEGVGARDKAIEGNFGNGLEGLAGGFGNGAEGGFGNDEFGLAETAGELNGEIRGEGVSGATSDGDIGTGCKYAVDCCEGSGLFAAIDVEIWFLLFRYTRKTITTIAIIINNKTIPATTPAIIGVLLEGVEGEANAFAVSITGAAGVVGGMIGILELATHVPFEQTPAVTFVVSQQLPSGKFAAIPERPIVQFVIVADVQADLHGFDSYLQGV